MLAHDKRQLVTIFVMTILIPLFLGALYAQWLVDWASLAPYCCNSVCARVGGMYWRIKQTQPNFTNLVAALFLSCLFTGSAWHATAHAAWLRSPPDLAARRTLQFSRSTRP